jgi:Cu/Zn superoxide dismutase
MRSITKAAFASFAISAATLGTVTVASAGDPVVTTAAANSAQAGSFKKSSFNINGDWTLAQENGQTIFRLSENFKTKNGPDLKLFLSPNSVGDLTGKTVTQDGVKLAVLKSSKGAQDYIIPDTIDVSQFKSIVIHCEAFSKLWGGADL